MYLRPASPIQTQNRTRLKLAAVEAETGTYALVLSARANGLVRIGRLGRLRLQFGFYVYVGSALGSGGVRGRVRHHLEPSSRPHWHIDHLRRHTSLEEVWYRLDRASWEHSGHSASAPCRVCLFLLLASGFGSGTVAQITQLIYQPPLTEMVCPVM